MARFDPRIFMTAVRLEAGEGSGLSFSLAQARQLLKLESEAFLVQAYRSILGREIDTPGLQAYRPLAASMSGKMRILAALMLSPERTLLPAWLRVCLKAAARICNRSQGG